MISAEAILGIIVTILTICFGIIGYFLKIVHLQVEVNRDENGKNKGRIELLQVKLENEVQVRGMELKSQQEKTEKAIEHLADNMKELSADVKTLIKNIK